MKLFIRVVLAFMCFLLSTLSGFAQSGIITTVAGTGTSGFSGDGGLATLASLSFPSWVAFDAAGNLYITDVNNNRIRKVTLDGVISTVAGNGTFGFSGDGGAATSASLSSPSGLVLDADGNLYFGDNGSRIRKVTPGGVISTVVGNGAHGFSGDGGLATSASINFPGEVAFDAAGNLYIADTSNNRVRKVTPGGVISTAAGNGGFGGFSGDGGPAISASFNRPTGVALDVAGNLYIADGINRRVRKVTVGGVINTVAGNGVFGSSGDGGPATSATFSSISGLAMDAAGNLYIADGGAHCIRKVTPGGVISTIAGNGISGSSGDGGPATSAEFQSPVGISLDGAGNLYIADQISHNIRKVDLALGLPTIASITPSTGVIGQIVNVTFDGTNFVSPVDINAISGITVSNPAVIGPTAMTATFTISTGAEIGTRTVTITTSAGTSNAVTFSVDPALSVSRTGTGSGTITSSPAGINCGVLCTTTFTPGQVFILTATPAAGSIFAGWSGDPDCIDGSVTMTAARNCIARFDLPQTTLGRLRGDFNGDGKSDIVWQHTDGSTNLWLMNGLTMTDGAGLIGPSTGWSMKFRGDFNGDGNTDIVWQNTDGSMAMWLMNGLSLIGGSLLIGPATGWSVTQVGDFNGDGKSDILWKHTDGSSAMWLMDGLSLLSGAGLLGPGTGWSITNVGDFNGDGKTDILWQNIDGSAAVWLMNGVGLLTGGGLLGPATGWRIKDVGDFNGDGKSDIVWQHTDGSMAMWLMDGVGLISGRVQLGAGTGFSVKLIGDFNGDGKSDVLWQNTDGSLAMWLMDGLGITGGTIIQGPGTGWSPVCLGDFNADGKNDIVVLHTDGRSAIWLMDGLSTSAIGNLLGPATGWSPAP